VQVGRLAVVGGDVRAAGRFGQQLVDQLRALFRGGGEHRPQPGGPRADPGRLVVGQCLDGHAVADHPVEELARGSGVHQVGGHQRGRAAVRVEVH